MSPKMHNNIFLILFFDKASFKNISAKNWLQIVFNYDITIPSDKEINLIEMKKKGAENPKHNP